MPILRSTRKDFFFTMVVSKDVIRTGNRFDYEQKDRGLGMGRTWEKFSSLPAKKPQPEKKTFSPTEEGRISGS